MQVLYTATAAATGGRQGSIRSSDGVLDLRLALPKELGGPGGAATNPEQLFAAGYAACFENALLRVARERKTPIRESSVTAHVGIGREENGYFKLAVELEISVPNREKLKSRNWFGSPMRKFARIRGRHAAIST
jgi:Ohr subfamily peroxiredoxin